MRRLIFALALWPTLAFAQVQPQVDAISANILRGVAALGNRVAEDEMTITQLRSQLDAVTKERDALKQPIKSDAPSK